MIGADLLDWLQSLWIRHRRWLLPALVALMTIAAALKLEYQFRRLVLERGPNGAVDLVMHLHWAVGWFSGQPVYQEYGADYPPASFVLLWPFLGWLSVTSARWLWAATSVAALAAMVFLAVRISGVKENWERCFVTLLFLSMSGTAVTIGNGQLILHILLALLAGVLVLNLERNTWGDDLVIAALLTWTLVKPSVAAPFLWVFLFGWNRWRPLLLVFIMYSFLTLVAAAFQKESLPALLEMFFRNASMTVIHYPGTRNIHALLADIGLSEWMPLCSVLMFAALGVWAFCYRHADRWVLVAVAAVVARMWTYHRVYDDMLILLPEVALLRIAKQSLSRNQSTVAGTLLGLSAIAMLCPGWLLEEPRQRAWIWNTSHVVLWLLVLAYLMNYARRDRRRSIRIPAR
jgi:Glycosyltransferase family 87